jgi:drug/metabolite transporter (DMT)-like permease
VNERSPNLAGAAFGLGAAALFGASAPLAKLLLARTGPLLLSALLYLGAAAALYAIKAIVSRSDATREARLQRSDWWPLLGMVTLGGMLGPLLMLLGLQRISALAGSLLLNFEVPFTAALAVWLFHEHLGRRGLYAVLAIMAGAALLEWQPGAFRADWIGVIAIVGACLCWGFDNNLTQLASMRDPATIALIKALGAGGCMLAVAIAAGSAIPPLRVVASALLLGAVSYGCSLYLAVRAMRELGAAREAAYFATAPFIGAALSMAVFAQLPSVAELIAAASMAAGILLLLREQHRHTHVHSELVHDHMHVHDEHHAHHAAAVAEPHSHMHRHAPLEHEHEHASDAHHRHAHAQAESYRGV